MSFENQQKTGDSEPAGSRRAPGRPKKERPPLDVEGIPDANFEQTIEKHESLVVLSREKYERLLRAGDPEARYAQVTYNQSLKQAVALREEAERRSVFAREHIRASEAREAMLRLAGLIVERLDALGSECGENCNPKDPVKAIGVLTDWAREAREKIARVAGVFEEPKA
jgi:hypothetical protein